MSVSINAEQRLYVIKAAHGYSTLGFDYIKEICAQIALVMGRPDMAIADHLVGTLTGYSKYLTSIGIFSSSPAAKSTFYRFGTDAQVQKVIEKYRNSDEMLRFMFGDPETGVDDCGEFETVGFVGRSMGLMKVPLIIEPGEMGGGPISTHRVLRILRVRDGKELYRHPLYQVPNITVLELVDASFPEYSWAGYQGDELVARFTSAHEATEWAAFLKGEIPCKREHLKTPGRYAA